MKTDALPGERLLVARARSRAVEAAEDAIEAIRAGNLSVASELLTEVRLHIARALQLQERAS